METILDISWALYCRALKWVARAIVLMSALRLVTSGLTRFVFSITRFFSLLHISTRNFKYPLHRPVALIKIGIATCFSRTSDSKKLAKNLCNIAQPATSNAHPEDRTTPVIHLISSKYFTAITPVKLSYFTLLKSRN